MAKLVTLPSTAEAKVLLGSAMSKSRAKTNEMVDRSSSMAASLISTTMTFSLIIAVSVFLYGTFYYAYMPVEMVNLPVNLGFEPCEGQTSARCTFPTASLAMGRHQQLLQGQAYTIRLSLDVPDSPQNEDLGMFMACMNITGNNWRVISHSCKSSVTEYRSPMLRTLETLAYLPLLLAGVTHQRQSLQINFFEDFHPDPHSAAQAFNLQLKSAFIQVTSAKLHIEASLSGLRHLMYRHSWISAVLGIGTNILVLFTIIGVSWSRFRVGHAEIARDGADAELEEEGSEEPELGAVEEGDEEQVEQEVREVAAVVEQPRALGQSLGNKFKWFLIRLVFKMLMHALKVVILAVVAVVCFEAVLQGTDATRESLLEATKSDLLNLGTFVLQQLGPLVARIKQ